MNHILQFRSKKDRIKQSAGEYSGANKRCAELILRNVSAHGGQDRLALAWAKRVLGIDGGDDGGGGDRVA
jgi:hypothetical protein